MHEHMMQGPWLGNLLIIIFSGMITVGCFAAMVWMIVHPGEADRHHPKRDILRDDR